MVAQIGGFDDPAAGGEALTHCPGKSSHVRHDVGDVGVFDMAVAAKPVMFARVV